MSRKDRDRQPYGWTLGDALVEVMRSHGPEGVILYLQAIVQETDQIPSRKRQRVEIMERARVSLKQLTAVYAPSLPGRVLDLDA